MEITTPAVVPVATMTHAMAGTGRARLVSRGTTTSRTFGRPVGAAGGCRVVGFDLLPVLDGLLHRLRVVDRHGSALQLAPEHHDLLDLRLGQPARDDERPDLVHLRGQRGVLLVVDEPVGRAAGDAAAGGDLGRGEPGAHLDPAQQGDELRRGAGPQLVVRHGHGARSLRIGHVRRDRHHVRRSCAAAPRGVQPLPRLVQVLDRGPVGRAGAQDLPVEVPLADALLHGDPHDLGRPAHVLGQAGERQTGPPDLDPDGAEERRRRSPVILEPR
ncbi:hypothetical protein IOD16_22950 [Saccharothrix sp. 6-C]|uniref:hypothetical protein n=1 Tax=Saccharothrix sp. 6-C TaxID=2781735 RepID=UPI001916F364|nr:hypothetical protein [Saccharothrix sp. 6-C]QQQ74078.1 hypothetical protein IOD16_22950 [Saccharothrix sp. 6-C]